MNIMKEKLMRFMYGRYGVDTFGKFLLWSGVILMLITSIFHFRIFYVIGWAFVIYSYYRMFSRQTYKRALENQKFLQHTSKKLTIRRIINYAGSLLNTRRFTGCFR